MLKIADKAPTKIKILDDEGEKVSLEDLAGKYVVLYFYPKDDTPGCTKEACSIRDWKDDLKRMGVQIVGVSKDSPASHQKFMEKYKLNFRLWSDQKHELMKAFGVWQRKSFMGRSYMGALRSTFAINPKGKIIHVWGKVTPDDHGEEIYDFMREYIKKRS